jgi:transcriptional regulator with XRE-family HTH domain
VIDLRAERIRRGLTLPQLADAAGIPYTSARRVERGLRIREDTAKQLADYLGVDPIDVLPEEVQAA